MHSGSLAQNVRAGAPLAGLLVKMPSAVLIEIAADVRFDFVVIDTEHGVSDASLLEGHLRAADAAGVPALVRIPRSDESAMLFALDAGAAGIVVPRVMGAADVDEVVKKAYYPPVGERGLALSTRAGRHGLKDVGEHVAAALSDTVLVVQIEDATAVAQAAEIAIHPRVDAVFIGPNDLSSSLGYPGQKEHPEVRAAIAAICEAVGSDERTALCMLAGSAGEVLNWRARGASMAILTAELLVSRCLAEIAAQLQPGKGDIDGN
jgi:4-hydroxy-2-oxoheptanedioate aldolase